MHCIMTDTKTTSHRKTNQGMKPVHKPVYHRNGKWVCAYLKLDGGMIDRVNAIDIIGRWRVNPNPITWVRVFHILPAYFHPLPWWGQCAWSDTELYAVFWVQSARKAYHTEFFVHQVMRMENENVTYNILLHWMHDKDIILIFLQHRYTYRLSCNVQT